MAVCITVSTIAKTVKVISLGVVTFFQAIVLYRFALFLSYFYHSLLIVHWKCRTQDSKKITLNKFFV